MSAATSNEQHYVGVELCAATARAALVTHEGQVVARREAAFEPSDIAPQLSRLVSSLRDETGMASPNPFTSAGFTPRL